MGYDDDGVKTLTDAAAADRSGFGRRGDQVGIALRLLGMEVGFILIGGGGSGSWTARAENGAVVGIGRGRGRRAEAIGHGGLRGDGKIGDEELHV